MALWTKIFVFLAIIVSSLYCRVNGEPQVPCFFVFGDSLSDNGNNNKLPTLAKCKFLPYGIDFPQGPTGRFTNGRTVVDVLAELLGFDDYVPPFGHAKDVLKGLNYASGSAGIRDESGMAAGFHISMNMQIMLHKITVDQIHLMFKDRNLAEEHLNKCLYSVGIGNNDYLNNYLLDYYPTNRMYTPKKYANVLAEEYTNQLKILYSYGARKFILIGVASLGCIPNSIYRYGNINKTRPCVEEINDMALLFNDKIVEIVNDFNVKLPDAQFVYVNISGMSRPEELIKYGFTNSHEGCCNASFSGMCVPKETSVCPDRDKYFYFDQFHPCDAANELVAKRAYKDLHKDFVYPFDINQLASGS